MLLTSAAYVHLKHSDLSKHTRNLSPASRAILLSGPAGTLFDFSILHGHYYASFSYGNLTACLIPTELYHQMLAKALAHVFESKLLLLDVTDFSIKVTICSFSIQQTLAHHTVILICHFVCILQIQSKYGCTKKESVSILCPTYLCHIVLPSCQMGDFTN